MFSFFTDDLLVNVSCRDLKPENILLDSQVSQIQHICFSALKL